MKNDVFIQDTKLDGYNNDLFFNPSQLFPEGLDINLQSDVEIYKNIRQLFINMKLDYKNIGTKNWNPFGDFIKENDNVLIKPNLVYHINNSKTGNMDALITNFAIIRPIIDYTIIALKKTGSIIVGDAPVQECDFVKVIKYNKLKTAIEKYNKLGYEVDLIDFRKNNNDSLECIEVSLNEDSSLVDVDKYWKQFAISNYNLKMMHNNHQEGIHKYLFPKVVLNADVIINLPKAKTHRIAGFTACLKNFVGVNAKKEYLPHHRNGNIYHNGDEYPEKSLIKCLQSHVKNYTYLHNKMIDFINLSLRGLQKMLKKNRYLKGCWYGNDTIWRTILDINKVVLYASKEGKMQDKPQRKIFNLVDMIVSGEGEGPLKPNNKVVGLILASFNQLNLDKTICHIMNFDSKKIKYLKNGYKLKKYQISKTYKFKIFDQSGLITDISKYNKNFVPPDSWIEYLKNEEKTKDN